MTRQEILEQIADRIASIRRVHPVRVAIDGVDAAGKTTLADELAELLEKGSTQVIRASIDGFHRPRTERYRRGPHSPEGYYHDSFDYESLREELLEQLGEGGSLRYRRAIFDHAADVFLYEKLQTAMPDSVLLFDGVFLLRPALNDLWDFRIFVSVSFDTALERAIQRDTEIFGSPDAVRERYERRYIPGQRLYLESVRPNELADAVVENDDPARPVLRVS